MIPSLNRKAGSILIGAIAAFLFLGRACFAESPRYIRVAVVEGAASLNIKAAGTFVISDFFSKKVLARGKHLSTTVLGAAAGILISGKNLNSRKLFIKTSDPDTVIINGRTYRGDVALVKDGGGKLSAINYIELEDYIKGISVREISHYWPPEAIKASVIVFRAFALYKMQEGVSRDYDVTSDIYSQVYSGKAAERFRINKIADETSSMYLSYRGKVLPAFYHACCGGATENAALLWNIDMAPLAGVACPFCKESPHFNWHYVFDLKELEEKLIASGNKISGIKEIAIVGYDKSGRITDLKFTSGAKELKVSAKDFRNIAGPNIIKSTNFSVKVTGSDAVFEGRGWGHGAGLCQWGSYFMAKEGKSCQEILQYYYPGSEISRN